jgi:hypothetical protein
MRLDDPEFLERFEHLCARVFASRGGRSSGTAQANGCGWRRFNGAAVTAYDGIDPPEGRITIMADTRFEVMDALRQALDEALNGAAKGQDRKTGFALFVFPFDDYEGHVSYISNGATRGDVATLLKALIKRLEGLDKEEG